MRFLGVEVLLPTTLSPPRFTVRPAVELLRPSPVTAQRLDFEAMYATCLFCHGALGRNESVEHFPVGRRLAYDAERGRLWVVCPRCARWNLSPLEERWEAIEECERLFERTSRRVSTDNIALAKLAEGLTLVRVGRPNRPEFAAWRYGAQIEKRRRQTMLTVGLGLGAFGAVIAGGVAAGIVAGPMFWMIQRVGGRIVRGSPNALIARVTTASRDTAAVRRRHLEGVRLGPDPVEGWALHVPTERGLLRLAGDPALRTAARLLPGINRFAGSKDDIERAVSFLGEHADPVQAYRSIAGGRSLVAAHGGSRWVAGGHAVASLPDAMRLALEMAAHEEEERRALEGELAALEEAWREAEEIAKIADDMFLPTWITERIERWR